jgi:hypothetical protein
MHKDQFNTTGCVAYNMQFLTQPSHCLRSDVFLRISLHLVFNLTALVLECLSVLTLSFTQRLHTWWYGFDSREGLISFYCDCEQNRFSAHPVVCVYSTWSCFHEGRVDELSVKLIFLPPLKSRNDSITARSCWFFYLNGAELSFAGVLISP